MKKAKIMVGFMVALLMATMAFAVENGQKTETTNARETEMIQVQAQVFGLENAIFRVQKQEQKQHLERVMNMVEEKRQERLNQLEGLVVEEDEAGKITAEGKGEAKFLGLIKTQKRFQYRITEEGEMRYQRQWYDGLFQFEE